MHGDDFNKINRQHLIDVYSCFVELLMQFFVYLNYEMNQLDAEDQTDNNFDECSLVDLICQIPINKQFNLLQLGH